MACNWGTFLKAPMKTGLCLAFTNQKSIMSVWKEYTFYKSNYPFLFVYIALKIYIILLQIFYHKNILLYKSVCINIRGVASCRRNVV